MNKRTFKFNGILDAKGKDTGCDGAWLHLVYEDGSKAQYLIERGQHIELSDDDIAAVKRGPGGAARLGLFDEVVRASEGSEKVTQPKAVDPGDPPAIESMNKPAVIEELEKLGVEFNKRDSADDLRALLAESREAAND